MDLAEHFRIIWRRKWWVMGVSVLIAALVFLRSGSFDDVYAADATLEIQSARALAGEAFDEADAEFLAQVVSERAVTRPVLEDALANAGLDIDVDEAERRVSASRVGDAGFLEVSATGPSPDDAASLVDGVALAVAAIIDRQQAERRDELLEPLDADITETEAELAALEPDAAGRLGLEAKLDVLLRERVQITTRPVDRVRPLAPAEGGSSPVAPTPANDAILALVVAAVVNAELWVGIEVLSDKFRREDLENEVRRVVGVPIMGRIPQGDEDTTREPFRALRTNLLFSGADQRVRTVAVVGVEPGGGKSHIAIGLATAIADLEMKSILIDADLRHPVLHRRLMVPWMPGLGDLRSRDDVSKVSRPVSGIPHLHVVPAGTEVADPAGILAGGFRELLAMLDAEIVVVDTPAGGLFAETTAVAAQCDATLLIVDVRATRRRGVATLMDALRESGANVVGVVLNRAEVEPAAAYYERDSVSRA